MTYQTLGQYIRAEREPYMTLRAFAKELGVSASSLSDIELGRRKVNKKMLQMITCLIFHRVGGKLHERYNTLLRIAGLMSPERECLLNLWFSEKRFHVSKTHHALYHEIDTAYRNFVDDLTGGGKCEKEVKYD